MHLELQIREIHASAPPFRALYLECNIHNLWQHDVTILEAWITVTTGGNTILVDGHYFQQLHAPSGKAIIQGRKQSLGKIIVPMTQNLLTSIEKEREGKDLQLIVYSSARVAPVESVKMQSGEVRHMLGVPEQTHFISRSTSTIYHSIPQSDWIKLLSSMKWSEIELFEIPMDTFSSDPNIQRAIGLLHEAQNRFSRGDWPGTLQNCRQAFEAAAADIGQTGNKKNDFQKLSDRLGGGIKSEKLNALISSLSGFAHLGRHEDVSKTLITREDAHMGLRCTLSIFALLGGKIH